MPFVTQPLRASNEGTRLLLGAPQTMHRDHELVGKHVKRGTDEGME
jgi:hypothetical protein